MAARAGDWNCPKCGDLQFARNTQCRQCGEPKADGGGGSGGGGGAGGAGGGKNFESRDGDWNCPQCGDLQFAFRDSCRRCGIFKDGAAGGAQQTNNHQTKPGDWNCSRCGDLQFARNVACRKCYAPKPANAQLTTDPNTKPGDWNCPSCGDLQFARRDSCRQCNTPKPQPGMMGYPPNGQMGYPGGYGFEQAYQPYGAPPPQAPQGGKSGDWMCPSCGDLQFSRRTECRQCNTPRPAETNGGNGPWGGGGQNPGWAAAAIGGWTSTGGDGSTWTTTGQDGGQWTSFSVSAPAGGMGMGGAMAGAAMGGRPGDWTCPKCFDLQFARNSKCRKCDSDRPAGGGIITPRPTQASYQRPGDWLCPQCGDLQFARNGNCRQCNTEKPAGVGDRPGDWSCPSCGDLQFSFRNTCRKCGIDKPGGGGGKRGAEDEDGERAAKNARIS